MNKFLSFLLIFCVSFTNAQELNCTVTVDAQKVGTTNQKVFKTLETSLNELVNKTAWTTTPYKTAEKISCGMTIVIDGNDNDEFTGSIQVQSSRTAFNSTYQSPVFNFNDKNFSFKYQEFESLLYSPNSYDSNLVGVIAFYSYVIIALDKDTFSQGGGNEALEAAVNLNNLAQSSGYKGWGSSAKELNRFALISDLTSPTFSPFRDALYEYHINGIDLMSKDPKQAKTKIISAINNLKTIHLIRPNSFIMRIFFDAKVDEIVSIFSGGPRIPVDELVTNLNSISPLNGNKWGSIN